MINECPRGCGVEMVRKEVMVPQEPDEYGMIPLVLETRDVYECPRCERVFSKDE